MRRITWITILSMMFVLGIAGVASAALPGAQYYDTTTQMTNTGGAPTNNVYTYTYSATTDGTFNGTYTATVKGASTSGSDFSNTGTPTPRYDPGAGQPFGAPTDGTTGARIHGGYTANTDACASCHAPHTGAGESLLQWNDVTSTCMACHDGTVTTTYNVNSGITPTVDGGQIANDGGKFGFDAASVATTGHSAHAVGAVALGAAPGGDGADVTTNGSTWADTFDCASCHSPHGQGGNARLLAPDINDIATDNQVTASSLNPSAAQPAKTDTINHASIHAMDLTSTGSGVYQSVYAGANVGQWLAGYPYGYNVYNGTTKLTLNKDYSLNLMTGTVTLMGANAGVAGLPINATYIPSLSVKMNVHTKLTKTEQVTWNTGIDEFCGACHTDYNTSAYVASGSGSVLTGTYTQAFRHQVGYTTSDKGTGLRFEDQGQTKYGQPVGVVVCLTCHFAHGTDDTFSNTVYDSVYNKVYIGQTPGTSIAAYNGPVPTGLVTTDPTRSSALKRIPNMGVCEACHQKGAGSVEAGQTSN